MNIATLRAPRKTDCPSCGATVPFQSRVSVQVVCPFCRSTLVRDDLNWEDVGKMAALADDLSPIRVGMTGKIEGNVFSVIGRLQKQHEDGIWNEWLVSLNNNQTAWLSEGSGLFYLTTAIRVPEALPSFMSLFPGMIVRLDGREYAVSDIEKATCLGAEGEIPFRITTGETANAADLVSSNGLFATIDYGEFPPRVYSGKILKQSDIVLSGAELAPKYQLAGELRCNGCGSAMTVRNPDSVTVACASCLRVYTKSPRGKIIKAFDQTVKSLRPRIPLESRGKFGGREYEVVGWMRRRSAVDHWDEYLLYNAKEGVRWLIEADGHWTLMSPVSNPPPPSVSLTSSVRYEGSSYSHYATYPGTVDAVLGEFYWRVRKGENNQCIDFINPPHVLCRESSSREVTWSHGVYLQTGEVVRAFSLTALPAPKGIGINQPAPAMLHYVYTYVAVVVLAMMISGYMEGERKPTSLHLGEVVIPGDINKATFTSEPFTLDSPSGLLRIDTNTNIDNHWATFDYTLVNQDSGQARETFREVSQYNGTDYEGYRWIEGSTYDSAYIPNVKAGRYVVEVSAQTESYNWRSERRPDIKASMMVEHARPDSKNFWVLFWVLMIGPLVALVRKTYFEQKRWENSDHPWETE